MTLVPSRPDFDLRTERRPGGKVVVSVTGELDASTSGRLREEVVGLIAEGNDDVVLDLTAVEFLDSTGLGAFVGAMQNLRDRGGRLTLASPTPQVTRMLDISGLSSLVPVVVDLTELERDS